MTTLVGEADGDRSTGDASVAERVAQQQTQTDNNSPSRPGRRLYNPLSQFASYTYNLSLYMVTPEAYDAFIQSGRKNINAFAQASANATEELAAGVYLIAQSGGVNNSTSRIAPGFELNYYIDNLKIKTLCNFSETQTNVIVSDMNFQIIEPYGFSFITNLKNAQDSLQEYVNATGRSQKGLQNPTRQFFILGIKFVGYDQQGNIVDTSTNTFQDDPAASNGVFENFFDIVFRTVKFEITGKASVYTIEAASLPSYEAFGIKRGLIDLGANFEATTVYDAIEKLKEKLNSDQQNLLNSELPAVRYADEYDFQYKDDMEARFQTAIVVSQADLQKYTWGGSGAKTTDEVTEDRANSSIANNRKRQFTFQGTTPVIQALNQIVSQSSYLEDALKVIYTTNVEPNPEKKSDDQIDPKSKTPVRWFNVSAVLSDAKWDDIRSDFAYKITYIITPYDTPVIQNSYSNPGVKYYGPHKRYKYWYTGKNQEIISYKHTLNTAFFNQVLDSALTDALATGGPVDVPQKPNQRVNQPHLGKLNLGMEAQNAYINNLYSPADFAEAKISILGDPDYLISDSELPTSAQNVYNKFYGNDGFTIKANGGQVFIEIDFIEAVDVDTGTGIMKLNDKILFWRYPDDISKVVEGVSYRVTQVDSVFNQGKFTQLLTCKINTFDDPGTLPEQGREDNSFNVAESRRLSNRQQPGTPSAPGTDASGTGTTGTTGLRGDSPVSNISPTSTGNSVVQRFPPSGTNEDDNPFQGFIRY